MKLWLLTRPVFNYSASHRPIFSYTLHRPCRPRLFICCPHYPRRKLRLTSPKSSRKRCLVVLHLFIPAHWSRYLLQFLSFLRDLKYWCNSSVFSYGYCISWLRFSMGTNVLLRRHSNHKPFICYSIRREYTCPMTLGRICRR